MSNDSPLITTVIPTYRRPHMLKRAVRSILNQTYPNLRVAVFDNASGDETGEVVAQLMRADSRVTYHCHPQNVGMINNFNYAMQHVETPYFSLLSDDDMALPHFYETVLAGFERYPDALLSAGNCIAMSDAGHGARICPHMPREGYYTPPEGLLSWRVNVRPMITGTLYRREAIERYGLHKDVLNSDLDFELRVVAQAPYVVNFRPCAIVISHDQNATKLADPEIWWQSFQAIMSSLEAIPGLQAELMAQVKRDLHQDFAGYIHRLGLLSIVRRDYDYVEAAIVVLRDHYRQDQQATALHRALNIQRRIPLVRLGTDIAYRVRKAVYEVRNRQVERQYRGYVLNGGG
jgi:glycosyltransferase involved in cell wall biosynthesis